MIKIKTIDPASLRKNPFQLIGKDWMLITAGNKEKVNTMTASWGGLGVMYGKDVAFIVIRQSRYTKEFIDQEDTFSISFYDKEHQKTMKYLGTVSGRNEDKIANSGLTLNWMENTPYFDEANMVMVCKKLFKQPLINDGLIEEKYKNTWYSSGDNHTLYIAEITNLAQLRHYTE